MKTYTVINRFNDREDKNRHYADGKEYPHKDAPYPNDVRVKELIRKGHLSSEPIKKEVKSNG